MWAPCRPQELCYLGSYALFIHNLNLSILRFNTPLLSHVPGTSWIIVTQVVLETGLLIFVDIAYKHADGSFLIIFCCVSVRVHASFRFTSVVLAQSHLKNITWILKSGMCSQPNQDKQNHVHTLLGIILHGVRYTSMRCTVIKKWKALETKGDSSEIRKYGKMWDQHDNMAAK